MKNFILEVVVDSVESAVQAVEGGADRFELCANLIIGGTTPSLFLFREVRKICDIPIHPLIRPRFGDFCYTDNELRIIENEVRQFKDEGAQGIVIGALNPDGYLNLGAMETLCRAADGMSITLHRAFDKCREPFETLQQVEDLGIHTILTSGQQNNCLDGAELLAELVARNQADIMPGGGVTPDTIRRLWPITRATSYHMSGKIVIDSPMTYRNENVSMGLPSISENEIWRTSVEQISTAKQVLSELK